MLSLAYQIGSSEALTEMAKSASLPYVLANAAAGGLGGYLMTDRDEDKLRNAVIGAGLGGLTGGLALRRPELGALGFIPGMAAGALGGGVTNIA